MKLLPLNSKILLLPDPPQTHTGDFEIPEGYRKDSSEGVIVSVPSDEDKLLPGDRVFFHNNSGVAVTRDGRKYLFVKRTELYGREPRENELH